MTVNYRNLLTSELIRIANSKVWDIKDDDTRDLMLELVTRMDIILNAIKDLDKEA